jgi:hypothetical protein
MKNANRSAEPNKQQELVGRKSVQKALHIEVLVKKREKYNGLNCY